MGQQLHWPKGMVSVVCQTFRRTSRPTSLRRWFQVEAILRALRGASRSGEPTCFCNFMARVRHSAVNDCLFVWVLLNRWALSTLTHCVLLYAMFKCTLRGAFVRHRSYMLICQTHHQLSWL